MLSERKQAWLVLAQTQQEARPEKPKDKDPARSSPALAPESPRPRAVDHSDSPGSAPSSASKASRPVIPLLPLAALSASAGPAGRPELKRPATSIPFGGLSPRPAAVGLRGSAILPTLSEHGDARAQPQQPAQPAVTSLQLTDSTAHSTPAERPGELTPESSTVTVHARLSEVTGA